MLSASTGSGRGSRAAPSSGASIGASSASRSAVTSGPSLRSSGGERGQQRIQRQRAVKRPAVRGQHDVAGGRPPGGPRAQQGRLADARLALDDDQLDRAVRARRAVASRKVSSSVAADER